LGLKTNGSVVGKLRSSDLQASQAKLNELNGQLDVLMNEMKAP